MAVGAGEIGTSIAVCTLPAFTVMVLTFTGLIGSAEPGLGWFAATGAGRGASGWAEIEDVVTDAGAGASTGAGATATGAIASARLRRGGDWGSWWGCGCDWSGGSGEAAFTCARED